MSHSITPALPTTENFPSIAVQGADVARPVQPSLFDYAALDTPTREFVQARTERIKTLVRRSGQDIFEIGQSLIEVQERLGHGQFGSWLAAEFQWTYRTARRLITVAERFKSDTVSHLPIDTGALYQLAAPSAPEEAVTEALERAAAGETITQSLAKKIVQAAKEIRAVKTQQRRTERKVRNETLCQAPTPLADLPHRFDLIYADPPWRDEFSKTDSRVIENQYPTMSLDDICAMPVGDIAIESAVLFLWATVPKLEEALRVLNAWGFSYRTAIAWDKVRMGQGIYTRQQVELLLIGIRGEMYSPELDYSKDFRSLVTLERSNKHSEKPAEFYDIIQGLYPNCTKIELFARQGREGWATWGNQVLTTSD